MTDPLTSAAALASQSALPVDPAKKREDGSSTDVLGAVADTVEFGAVVIDSATLAVEAGGLVLEAGVATVKIAASGLEMVGGILGAFDGL